MMDEPLEVPAPERETMLQQILGLIFLGPYLTTAIALLPALGLGLVWELLAWEVGGGFILFAGLLSLWWLVFLENWGRVRITTPVVPIPLLWLTPANDSLRRHDVAFHLTAPQSGRATEAVAAMLRGREAT